MRIELDRLLVGAEARQVSGAKQQIAAEEVGELAVPSKQVRVDAAAHRLAVERLDRVSRIRLEWHEDDDVEWLP
jgi:hypothetical protein